MFLKEPLSLMILSSLFLFACDANTQLQIETARSIVIQEHIIEQSDEYIRSQVGMDFFENYITFDKEKSEYYPPDNYCVQNPSECSEFLQKPNYLMVYSLTIPEIPYLDGHIEIHLDEEGELIAEAEPSGIPNCIATPIECEFPVDEVRAITIAENAGLAKGIKEWGKGSVHWYGGTLKTYVWTISNTLSEKGSDATGQTVIIDANTGEVLGEILTWDRQS